MSKIVIIKNKCTDITNFEISYTPSFNNLNRYGDFEKLELTKNNIETIDQKDWTRVRKFSNIYECPGDYNNFIKPVSRAYYKLWEILNDFKIKCDSDTLHLCEAPGGFIESTLKYKKKYSNVNTCHTMSLIDSFDTNIPKYNFFISSNKNVNIITNLHGNIYNVDNIKYLYNNLYPTSINFITADGGLTENNDYNNKELLHVRLILSEVFTSIVILENKGTFVLKIFDISSDITVHIIYLLSYLFDYVYLTKPLTSRPSNSEKYLVCKDYDKNKLTYFIKQQLFKALNDFNYNKNVTKLFKKVDNEFVKEIYDYNSIYIDNQVLCIKDNLNILKNNGNIKNIFSKKKLFTKNWMIKYNLIN